MVVVSSLGAGGSRPGFTAEDRHKLPAKHERIVSNAGGVGETGLRSERLVTPASTILASERTAVAVLGARILIDAARSSSRTRAGIKSAAGGTIQGSTVKPKALAGGTIQISSVTILRALLHTIATERKTETDSPRGLTIRAGSDLGTAVCTRSTGLAVASRKTGQDRDLNRVAGRIARQIVDASRDRVGSRRKGRGAERASSAKDTIHVRIPTGRGSQISIFGVIRPDCKRDGIPTGENGKVNNGIDVDHGTAVIVT